MPRELQLYLWEIVTAASDVSSFIDEATVWSIAVEDLPRLAGDVCDLMRRVDAAEVSAEELSAGSEVRHG